MAKGILRMLGTLLIVDVGIVIASAAFAASPPPPPPPKTLHKIVVIGKTCPAGSLLIGRDASGDDICLDYTGLLSQLSGGSGNLGVGYSPHSNTAPAKPKNNKLRCQGNAAAENTTSDPVNIAHGAKLLKIPFFQAPGEMGLGFALYYRSETGSAIGAGGTSLGFDVNRPWTSNIDYSLDLYCGYGNPVTGCDTVTLDRPDGSSLSFSGNYQTSGNLPEVGGGAMATLVHNTDGTWTLHDTDATTQSYGPYGGLQSIKDASGIGWSVTSSSTSSVSATSATVGPPTVPCISSGADGSSNCLPPPQIFTDTTRRTVIATSGESFTVVFVTKGETSGPPLTHTTVTVTDPAGNQYTYTMTSYYGLANIGGVSASYNAQEVTSVAFPGSPATDMAFTYTSPGGYPLLSGVAYNGSPYWTTTYNSSNRVVSDGAADGSETTSLTYTTTGDGLVATVTNALGLTTTNTYTTGVGGEYLLESVSNPAVQTCGATTNSFLWDTNDNIEKSTNNDRSVHTYDYAANGQLQTETQAAGTAAAVTTDYTWDPDQQLNRPLSVTIEGVEKTAYTYSAHNRIASVTQTNLTSIGSANQTRTTTYAYIRYANGMVQSMTVTNPSPNGTDKTTNQYDAYGNLISTTDGLGHVTTYSNYNGLGEVGKVVGPNGAETDYTYDARGRIASKTTHLNGTAATWTYGYDGYGLLASVSAPDGEVTTWTRDASMRVTSITHNDKDGTSTETRTYDAMGDVTSDVIARGSDIGKSATFAYDGLGRLYWAKGANGQQLTYAYDGNGNVLSVTDALGHKSTFTYDALDRVTSSTNPAGGVSHFAYDAGDHVVKVTDPRGLVTTYSYDGFGQLWKQVSPDTGTTTFAWDGDGRLASKTRADGTTVAYAYDALNRLTSASAGGSTRTYTWDSCTGGIGRLCGAAVSGQSSVDYSYTPQGQVAARAISISNGPVYTLGYGYTSEGQLAQLVYPDGNEAIYDYNRGVVQEVRFKESSGTVYAVANVSYQPMDLGMSGWTSRNGLSNTLGYDGDARLTGISVPGVENLAFTYDATDRITHIANGMDGSQSQSLGYDALGRLTSMTAGARSESYAYDADGNRVAQTLNGATTNFAYAASSNQLASTSGGVNATYGYNADGNTTTVNGLAAYSYGPFNRLVNAGGINYTISAEGQRLEKSGGGNTTYFAPGPGGAMLAEDLNGTWMDYVWLNGRLVSLVKNGSVYSIHDDQTGRPIAITAPSQAVVWSAAGLPFDRQVTANTFGDFNVGFPGQYFDSETGLYQNGARDYDAALGRFIESDPIGLLGGPNTYAYVGDNPITGIDPLGLCRCDQTANAANNSTGNHLSSGVSLSGATVNPLTSSGGGVLGRNWQAIPGGTSTLNTYNYSGDGLGLDVGASIQSVWAWGSGSWTGQFKAVTAAAGPFAASIFWTPGKGGYFGFSFGLGLGLPGLSYQQTNYTCKNP